MPSDPVRKAGKCEIICEYEGELLTVEEDRRARRAIERKEKSAPLWFSRVQVARLRECYYKCVHKRVLRFVL